MEGRVCAGGGPPGCGHASLVKPILEYGHTDGNCSVTGGFVYRGAVTAYDGTYMYGDFCSGIIWAATPNSPQWNSVQVLDTGYFISSFGEDQNGELYLADYFGGTIQKLVFTGSDTDGDSVDNSTDNCPTTVNPTQDNNDDTDGPFGGWQAWVVDGTGAEGAALGGDACDGNDDNNGCSDAREPTMAPARDAANPWDFADMWVPALPASGPATGNRNGAVSLADASAALVWVGTPNNGGTNIYLRDYDADVNENGIEDGAEYDRTPGSTSGVSGPPNGAVSLADVSAILVQVGDVC
jgi:hypothetical protein